eukprot:TRINITY_DN5_c1_g1_i2.p1 TRINITY_DN5_c1_g1~~TRINITY_DN5_c1_g1_i2.p1  ORF type:complete len:133 (-),score=57.24 TRINITY_DN5_c1_g1_i2:171-569(-)
MDNQWEPVILNKKTTKPKSNEDAVKAAFQSGAEIETIKKASVGNKNMNSTAAHLYKVENEDENLTIKKVPHTLSLRIQQARNEKGMTQKDLATKINEKPQVIGEYESGRAIPNGQIISKLERALGVKLRGKD